MVEGDASDVAVAFRGHSRALAGKNVSNEKQNKETEKKTKTKKEHPTALPDVVRGSRDWVP